MNTSTAMVSTTSPAKTFTWLVRREVWEHKAFWMVPLVIMGIIAITQIAALIQGSQYINITGDMLPSIDGFEDSMIPVVAEVIMFALITIFSIASGIVAFFYLLDSLYSERRDRSVLFWKSLPITDSATIGSKLCAGVVILPLIAVAAAFGSYLITVLLLTLFFGFQEGISLAGLWNPLTMLSALGKWLVFVVSQQIWFLPFYAWLLFCSAFAKKAPFLIAVLVPLGITFAENLVYRHSYLAEIIGKYVLGFFEVVEQNATGFIGKAPDFATGETAWIAEGMAVTDILRVFAEPKLYIGLVIAAGFIYASIWWRKNHVEL